MPKKKEPELMPDEQFKRFQEAAKERGVRRKFQRLSGRLRSLLRRKRENRFGRNNGHASVWQVIRRIDAPSRQSASCALPRE